MTRAWIQGSMARTSNVRWQGLSRCGCIEFEGDCAVDILRKVPQVVVLGKLEPRYLTPDLQFTWKPSKWTRRSHIPLRRPSLTSSFPSTPDRTSPPPKMLSFNPQPWQTSLIAAAQQLSGRQPSVFRRRHMASEVLPRLYLTDLFTARDEAQLSSLGITHVVSVIERAPALPKTQSLRTLHIPLSDGANQDILKHLPVATSFIRNALEEDPESRVLVSTC
jgi:hypothetical protein